MKVLNYNIDDPSFTFYPLSDVHYPEHNDGKLTAWLKTVKRDPSAVVTLGGDLFDFSRTTFRKHLRTYQEDNTSTQFIDNAAEKTIRSFARKLRPIANKIAAVCVGNHHYAFADGRVSDQMLASTLGIGETFVGALGLISINSPRGSCVIALHHDAGKKGGTISSDLLAFQAWSTVVDADIYAMGHTHRQYVVAPSPRLVVDRTKPDGIGDKQRVFVRSGAFLRGYSETATEPDKPFVPDYGEVKMYSPSAYGIVSIGVSWNDYGKPQYHLTQVIL